MNKRIYTVILSLLLMVLMLTGCDMDSLVLSALSDAINATQQTNTTSGTANTTQSPNSSDNGNGQQNIQQTIIQNNISITGGTQDSAYATAAGLRSAVSIYCTFETTYNSGWPGMQRPTTYSYYTTGSGVIYRLEENGSAFIVTNFHVVYDSSSSTANHVSDQIYIYLYGLEDDAYAIPATYVGGSSNYDIAVLYVEESPVLQDAVASGAAAAVTLGQERDIQPGMSTIAIGKPSSSTTELGGISVTQGIISVASEYITMSASDTGKDVQMRLIRTDTPVNPGNSGGGLFNLKGQMVGIVNAKISSSDLENISYAIPVSVVQGVADNIIDYCFSTETESVMRCLLGITVSTTELSTGYDSETGTFLRTETLTIQQISADSLADGILQAGDVLISAAIGNQTTEITRQYHLIDFMLNARVGNCVTFTILRDGTEMTVQITVTEDCLTAY